MKSASMRSIAVIASSQAMKSSRWKRSAASALRSTPVQKARPAPVITTTRGSSADSALTAAPRSRTHAASPALRTSGRFSVRRATWPSWSRRTWLSYILAGMMPRSVSESGAAPREPAELGHLETSDVEVTGRLQRRADLAVASARILKARHHLAGGVERDHVSIARGLRKKDAGQAHEDLPQERVAAQRIDRNAAGRDQRHPEASGEAARHVVGKARKVLDQRLRLPAARAAEPVTQDAVRARLGHQHVALVVGQRDAVGEVDAAQHGGSLPGGRIPDEQSPVAPMLDDLEQARGVGAAALPRAELGGGVGEVDAAVAGHVEVVGVRDRCAVGFRGQDGDAAVGSEPEQAAHRAGGDEAAARVGVEPERVAVRLGIRLGAGAGGTEPDDP